tara:strand:- start:206 stop:394 length:189 start_codon:yes stop_codon:yes gene_type:complete
MKSNKKAYTLTIIYDSKTGEIEYAEESIEKLKLEKKSSFELKDIQDDELQRLLKDTSIIGES